MDNKSNYMSRYRKVILIVVVLAGILLAITLISISGIDNFLALAFKSLQAFFFGLLFAAILSPSQKFLEKQLKKLFLKIKIEKDYPVRVLSVILSALLLLLIILGIILLIVPQLTETLQALIPNLDSLIAKLIDDLKGLSSSKFYQEAVYPALEDLLNNVSSWLTNHIGVGSEFFSSITTTVTSAVGTIGNALVGLVIAIYMMCDKEHLFAQIRKLCYAIFKDGGGSFVNDTVMEGTRIFSGFFGAKVIEAVANGFLCLFAMMIFQLPYAALISVIIGVTNIIPFFGPWIGLAVSALLILITNPSQTLLFIVIGIIIMLVDGNLLGPKILGKYTGLSALWVIVAIFFFGGLWGLIGMLIGVPLLAWIMYVVKRAAESSLRNQHLPTDTEAYLDKK